VMIGEVGKKVTVGYSFQTSFENGHD